MRPVIIRRLGVLLAFACSLGAAYCSVFVLAGNAQTTGTSTSSLQKTTKPPSAAANAAPAPSSSAPATSTTPSGEDGISFSTMHSNQHTGISTFTDWIYTRDDTVISGATAQLNRKTDTLDTDDPVVMDDPKHHLTADKAHVDHAEKDKSRRLVVLTGHAVMVLKPESPTTPGGVPPAKVDAPGSSDPGKLRVVSITSQAPGTQPQVPPRVAAPPANTSATDAKQSAQDKDREDAKAQQRHGGTATCDKIEYKTAKKFATLTGHVVFKQSFLDDDGKQIERTLTCEHAEYDGKANVLHLFKPVHYEDNDGQTCDTPEDALIGTKEGEETMTLGHAKMFIKSPDEDEDSADSKTASQKPAKPNTDKSTNKTSQ